LPRTVASLSMLKTIRVILRRFSACRTSTRKVLSETSSYLFKDNRIRLSTKPLKTYPFYPYIERVILYQFNKRLYSGCHKSVINHSRVAFELLFRSYPRNGCIRNGCIYTFVYNTGHPPTSPCAHM